MIYIKKNKDLFIFNYLLICIYFIVFISLKVDVNDQLMFSTVDSATYRLTGHEFYKFSQTGYSCFRPFLYPLLVLLIHNAFGLYGLWIMQLIFWISAVNLIFLALKKTTNSRTFSFTGGLIIASNISYIVLTFHALTEVTTMLLISILIYFISFNSKKVDSLIFFHGCLFILILLAVIKPVFYLPSLLMLFIVLPAFYLKAYRKKPKSLIILILITTPLLFQLTIMKMKYNTFTFSHIGSETFNQYFFAQGIQLNNAIGLEEARLIAKKNFASEEVSYIFDNKIVYAKIYFQNLKDNIKAIPCFTLYSNDFREPVIVKYMTFINALYYYIHLFFVIPVLLSIYFMYRKKMENPFLILLIFASFLTYYIMLTSPISFGEGDRLVLIALPLWVVLYSLVINYVLKKAECSFFKFLKPNR